MSAQWECPFCHKQLTTQIRFDRHTCNRMKKHELVETMTGRTAYGLFCIWYQETKRPEPSKELFMSSRFFVTFIKFVIYSRRVKLPNLKEFIKWSIKKSYPPTMWQFEAVYIQFLTYIDYELSPLVLASQSVNYIISWCEEKGKDTKDFFMSIHKDEMFEAIQMRYLSPWLLMFCKEFPTMLSTYSAEQRIILTAIISPSEFSTRMQHHSQEITQIKLLIKELGL